MWSKALDEDFTEHAREQRIAKLEAENAKLRAALEAVEWTTFIFVHTCPACKGYKPNHNDGCTTKAALGLKK